MRDSTLTHRTLTARLEPAPQDGAYALLWPATTVARWAALGAVSGLVLVGSWFSVAGEADWAEQRSQLNLAIGVLVVASFVSISMLLTGRRAIGLRRVALLGDLPVVSAGTAAAPAAASTRPHSDTLVAGDGLVRFHRADCPLVAGRDYQVAARVEHLRADRQTCGVCLP